MFTGLVEELGTIAALRPLQEAVELRIDCRETVKGTQLGDSIAVDGVCLTVTGLTPQGFSMLAGAETLRRTNLVFRQVGDRVNLERSLTLDRRLGGHLVQGHVDGPGSVLEVKREGETQLWRFSLPRDLARTLVPKGSVAVDGISLTVVDADIDSFTVSIIPKTLAATTLQFRVSGDAVNIETDIIGKYIWRYLSAMANSPEMKGSHGPGLESGPALISGIIERLRN
jgi:riboflavin synthase